MKKNIIIGVISILVIAGIITGYFLYTNKATEDAVRFKEEYEALNNELDDEGNYKYTKLTIKSTNKIVYLTYEELVDFIENKTGVLYIGRPACPWCRLLVGPMFEFAQEEDTNIYYYDIEKDRNENNDKYKNIVSLLNEYLPVDTVTQKESDPTFDVTKKRIVLPHLFFIKAGEVKDEIMLYQHEYLDNNENSKMKELLNSKYEKIK